MRTLVRVEEYPEESTPTKPTAAGEVEPSPVGHQPPPSLRAPSQACKLEETTVNFWKPHRKTGKLLGNFRKVSETSPDFRSFKIIGFLRQWKSGEVPESFRKLPRRFWKLFANFCKLFQAFLSASKPRRAFWAPVKRSPRATVQGDCLQRESRSDQGHARKGSRAP